MRTTLFRLMPFALALFAAGLAHAEAVADDPAARGCARLLGADERLHDPLRVLDRAYHTLRFRDWLCRSGFRSADEMQRAADGADMPNPDLGLIFGYRMPEEPKAFEAALQDYCSSGYQVMLDPALHARYQRMIGASMTDAYQACLARWPESGVGQNGVMLAYAEARDEDLRQFEVRTLWRKDSGAHTLRILTLDGAQCRLDGQAVSAGQQFDGENFHLACSKSPVQAASIELATDGGATQRLSLPGRAEADVKVLAELTTILADRVRYLERALDTLGPESTPEAADASGMTCPRGSYMVGLTGAGAIRCRVLPPNAPELPY